MILEIAELHIEPAASAAFEAAYDLAQQYLATPAG